MAETLPSNGTMQAVFRRAGFKAQQRFEDGVVKVTFPIEATRSFVEVVEGRSHLAERQSIDPILCPRAIAVIAAEESEAGSMAGHITEGGFTGSVYAVGRHGLRRSPT